MNRRFYLLAFVFVSLFVSCSSRKSGETAQTQEVVFDDGYKSAAKDEIVFDDLLFTGKNGSSLDDARKSSQEKTKITADGSQINTMYDGYGNQTDTRCFNYHPRIKCVMLRVAAATGEKQVFVYGQAGEVKSLPDNMLDKVLTASADEIAGAAGIFEQDRQTQPMIVQNSLPPLQPMPSYKFPVQRPPIETAPAENTETEIAAPPAETTKQTVINPTDTPKRKTENSAPDNQPDEKK